MSTTVWGSDVVTADVRGVPMKLYAQRPHRVDEVLDLARHWSTRTHLVQGDRVLTFADVIRGAEARAADLHAAGITAGERVFLLGWNSPDWIMNFWACVLAGAVPVLGNAWWSDHEGREALTAVAPSLTLADEHGRAKLPPATRCAPWSGAPSAATPERREWTDEHSEDDAAVIIFTSGTAGKPKPVVLSHRSLLAGLQMLLHITRRLPQQLDGPLDDTALHTGPLFHIGGIQTLLRAMAVGTVLVMPQGKFDPGEALALMERYRVQRWSAVPTMVSRVLEHPDIATRDLSALRSVTVGGAPVHRDLLERIRSGLPSVEARVPTGYGLTENGGQATAASGKDTAERPGSSGRPLPCVEVEVVPRPGLPDGEILLRAPTQMSAYFDGGESPIDAEGWLHTGDLGHLDDDGHLWITGRIKDVIIRGGENIASAAVEAALVAVPGVIEAAVLGVHHPDLGEEVMAFVVVEDSLTPHQLADGVRDRLARFAVPTRWEIQREPLPTNHAGKIDKVALAARAGELLALERA